MGFLPRFLAGPGDAVPDFPHVFDRGVTGPNLGFGDPTGFLGVGGRDGDANGDPEIWHVEQRRGDRA